MSTNIQVQRICEFCNGEFTAKTTVTKYCSHTCNRKAYKARIKADKVKRSNAETVEKIIKPTVLLQEKEFLTVREVAELLNCSVRSAYNSIDKGAIKAVNLGQRMTRVKRSEIDRLFQNI